MQVDTFMICDAAQESGGKLFVLGGAWNVLVTRAAAPVRHPHLSLAIVFSVDWNETNELVRFSIRLEDEDGQLILPETIDGELKVGRPIHLPVGSEQLISLVVNLQDLVLPRLGRYVFVVSSGDVDLRRSPFNVIAAPR